jgi:ribose transport system permease protein
VSAAPRALALPFVRAVLPLALVIVIGCIFNQNGAFFEWSTHRSMLREISVLGILACGMTVVILSGGIDLAVGSLLALAAVSVARLTLQHGLGALAAVLIVLAIGALAGAVSGLLVARYRMQAFIATLAMMVFARGLAKLVAGGKKVTNYVVAEDGTATTVDLPALFGAIDQRVFGDNVSIVTLILIGCAALTWVTLDRFRIGRYVYAVGGNLEAARLSGVPVRASLIFAYALSGLMAAIAGICQAAQETHGDPETGAGYELDAIAMVVLGGTSLMGGRGGIGLTLIGMLTLGYLQKVLSLNAFSTEARLMLTGAILVGAVLFQRRLSQRHAASD